MSQGRMERVEDLINMKQYEVSGISLVRGNHLMIYLGKSYVSILGGRQEEKMHCLL